MGCFEFLRTKGKTEETKASDRCKAIDKLGRLGLILSSVAGIGALSEMLVYAGVIDWSKVNVANLGTFYQWPEKARWLAVLLFFLLTGVSLNLLNIYLYRKFKCSNMEARKR